MSVKEIRLFGDPILRTPAAAVVDFDRELSQLVKDLTDTMLDAPGAGLAAPQLGVSLRVDPVRHASLARIRARASSPGTMFTFPARTSSRRRLASCAQAL